MVENNYIEELSKIILELDAREKTNNLIIEDFETHSWDDLCLYGMYLFQKLKRKDE